VRRGSKTAREAARERPGTKTGAKALPTIPETRLQDIATDGIRALDEAGCLIVTGVTDAAARDRVRAELAPHMDRAESVAANEPDAFFPGHTRRIVSLVARSESVRDWIMHPLARTLGDRFLLPHCDDRYQLHVAAALEVGPGASRQVLHRAQDVYPHLPRPCPELVLSLMWAVTDFTAANGGTLLVPGSHRWPPERRPEEDEIVAAEMEAGSVLVWRSAMLHGAGANVSDQWRYGVIVTYSLGWLRQEENQAIAVPKELARQLPGDLLDMVGYTLNGSLGFSEEFAGGAVDAGAGAALVEMNR